MRHAFTQLQSASPSASIPLSLKKNNLLWTQVSSYQRVCRSGVFSGVYYTATKQCLQYLTGLEAMRKNSAPACQRLCETGARCPLHKVL